MKKQIALMTFVILLVGLQLSAQIKRVEAFFGPGRMSMRTDNDLYSDGFDAKIAFNGGAGIVIGLSEKLNLNFHLLYERKGNKSEFEFRDQNNNPAGEGEVFLRLNTLSVPVTIGYEMGKNIRWQIAGGFYAGYFLTNKYEFKGDYGPFTPDSSTPFNDFDLGLTGSISAYIPVKEKIDFMIKLQENLGLLDITKPLDGGDYSYKTNALSLFFGLAFKL